MNLKDLIIDIGTPNCRCELCKNCPGSCDGSCTFREDIKQHEIHEVTLSMEDIEEINKKW